MEYQVLCRVASRILDLLAPVACGGCDSKSPAHLGLCAECQQRLTPPVDGGSSLHGRPLRTLGSFEAPLDSCVRKLKYRGRTDLIGPLAERFLLGQPPRPAWRDCLVVPVPVHPKRLVERGYNQTALLAAELARRCELQHAPRLLRKVRHTAPQASLKRAERLQNLVGAFEVVRKIHTRGRVILVDDVVSTGETTRHCTRALHASGFEVVEFWALARTPADSPPGDGRRDGLRF